MRVRRSRLLGLALPLLLSGGALGQAIPFDIELGYRWLDVTGSRDMYRSQVNEKEGFLLRSFSIATTDFGGRTTLVDQFRLDVSELGVGPAGILRLEAGRASDYRLRLFYSRTELFSALPSFANPLLSSGVISGQHLIDRARNVFDVEMELLPGRAVTPVIGYTRNRLEGPGQTTYTVGGDEFRLRSELADTDQEFRVGLSFHEGLVSGQVVQGWRRFRGNETLTLAAGAGGGNGGGPVLGTDPALTTFQRVSDTTANSPVTTAIVTGQVLPRLRVTGSYVRAKASGDSSDGESLAGNLVSFPLSRFFKGLEESSSSRADLTAWRGSGRVEANILPGVDLSAGYAQRHRELEGYDLVSSLFLDTTTFVGGDRKDILRLLEARTSLERTEKILDAVLVARPLRFLSVRAGWSQNDQDVTVTPDPAEIVVAGSQGGTFERRVRAFDGGATFSDRKLGLTLGADFRRERGDRPVVRTDFVVRDRVRLRATWAFKEFVQFGATAMQVDTVNRWPDLGFDGRTRQYGGDLEVAPLKDLRIRFSAARSQADSTIVIRKPQDFTLDTSVQAEDGRSYEGGVTWSFSPLKLDASLARFDNKGSFPFRIDRTRLRADLALTATTSAALEWAKDQYTEGTFRFGDYDANRYGLYVRWHP